VTRPVIFGCEGTGLSPNEVSFFREVEPLGFILFQRNCETPEQIKALTDSLKDLVASEHVPILIDQEGGRVARLKPPHWSAYPPMQVFGDMIQNGYEKASEALKLNCMLIADDLRKLGITVNCLPVLDLPQNDADPIIGDRAFSCDPHLTGALGRIVVESLMEGGILPVIKHIPGHGRALVDSHKALPVVDATVEDLGSHDFIPFRSLHDAPFGMTAHVTYTALDAEKCATQSAMIIQTIIRDKLGFKGFLMTDDLSMQALSGSFAERTRLSLEAGCDIALHCNGNLLEMEQIAGALKPITNSMVEEIDELLLLAARRSKIDRADMEKRYNTIMKAG